MHKRASCCLCSECRSRIRKKKPLRRPPTRPPPSKSKGELWQRLLGSQRCINVSNTRLGFTTGAETVAGLVGFIETLGYAAFASARWRIGARYRVSLNQVGKE